MKAGDENCDCPAVSVQQGPPVAGSSDSIAGQAASADQSDDAPAVCVPAQGRFSNLLKAMYYWVHSRS
jgi:hypothetical protein